MCVCVLYDRRRKKKALFRRAPDDAQGPDVAGSVRFHLRLNALVLKLNPSISAAHHQ
jgi:hypothetical protein